MSNERYVKTTIFLRSDKDSLFEMGEELGLKGEALSNFSHTLYGTEVEIVVDINTGNYRVLKIFIDNKEIIMGV